MSVTVAQSTADAIVIRITGEIGLGALVTDQHTGVQGDNALDITLRNLVPAPPGLVVIDLTGASFLSSMGIGTLMRFRNRVAPASDVRVAATGQLVTLLKMGRLDQLLPIFPSVPAALKG
jgi:hypothetical protein